MIINAKKPKPLATQLYEHRRKEEMQRCMMVNMNVAARRNWRRNGVPQFTEAEKAAIFKKGKGE